MIELKNKKGRVGCLHKYEDIKDNRRKKVIENLGDGTLPIKEREAIIVTFNDDNRIKCFNTMEDIQAQIRAIKCNVEEFESLPSTNYKIAIDYDVSAKDKNEIAEVRIGDRKVPSEFYKIKGSTLILDKVFPTEK